MTIGTPERATQDRILAVFRDELVLRLGSSGSAKNAGLSDAARFGWPIREFES